nr:MAG: internal scaffolding protein [Microvirus sp.]
MSREIKSGYARTRVMTEISDTKTRAVQSEAKFCDINHIVAKAHQTGQLPVLMGRTPIEEMPTASTYQEMMNTIVAAQQKFERLPAAVRSAFDNKPQNMLAALEASKKDEKMATQLREIGLLNPLAEPVAPVPVGDTKTATAHAAPSAPKGAPDPSM